MLEVIFGQKENPHATDELVSSLRDSGIDGTLYIGYPVVFAAGGVLTIDALLLATDYGIVAFQFLPAPASQPDSRSIWSELEEQQNDIYVALQSRLLAQRELRDGRSLVVPLAIVVFCPDDASASDASLHYVTSASLAEFIQGQSHLRPDLLPILSATIERVVRLKVQRPRGNVLNTNSRGARIKAIESKMATLDRWQKRAAIETPAGPQRIRGLAGSGKTIVLALKAAYLHAAHPEWRIALTFHTRSLYQQLLALIRRFSFEQSGEEPDWERLRVLHSWGSSRAPGLYSTVANAWRHIPRDFMYARAKYSADPFGGVCQELLDAARDSERDPVFDVVLMDEAQDLPRSFFELVFDATKEPKRVVWAYDELQNLSDHAMAPSDELFGRVNGQPRVVLHNPHDAPRQDILLPVCYRNSPWGLATAHALGFGVYRERGLVQFFDDPQLLSDVGYEIVEGALLPGSEATIQRRTDSYPSYFDDLLEKREVVRCTVCEDASTQAVQVADEVKRELDEGELEPSDILIVFPNPISVAADANALIAALGKRGINAHVAGVTSSRDELFKEDSIAISGIYRAKGNEAAMVFLINANYCVEGPELIKRRNTLFTAMTRARAWVRLYGLGEGMERLVAEVDRVFANDFRLRFIVPSDKDLARIRRIHKDLTKDEKARRQKAASHLQEALDLFERGEVDSEDLPPDLRARLRQFMEAKGES